MSSVDEALRDAEARVASLEAQLAPRELAAKEARALLSKLIKRRQRVQQRGVPMWEAAQRAAFRMVVVAVGCVGLITGASALDGTFGGVAIVVSMGVLVIEGMR
jgi:hypothetical protein